jgi:hypothetical protein
MKTAPIDPSASASRPWFAVGHAVAGGAVGLLLAVLAGRKERSAFFPVLWVTSIGLSMVGYLPEKSRLDGFAVRCRTVGARTAAHIAVNDDSDVEVTEVDALLHETGALADAVPEGRDRDGLRCALRITSALVGGTARVYAASRAVRAAGGTSMKGLRDRALLDARIAVVDAWLTENAALVRAAEGARAKAEHCFDDRADSPLARFGLDEALSERTIDEVIRRRRLEGEMASQVRTLFTVARDDFDRWRLDADGTVVSDDEALRRRWSEVVGQIRALGARQREEGALR